MTGLKFWAVSLGFEAASWAAGSGFWGWAFLAAQALTMAAWLLWGLGVLLRRVQVDTVHRLRWRAANRRWRRHHRARARAARAGLN